MKRPNQERASQTNLSQSMRSMAPPPFQLQTEASREMPANEQEISMENLSLEASDPKENQTGLPDDLKSGIENLSGYDMADVKVHYNSDKPVQLQAHAYAQGTDIHLGPGQEKHLPHEAWHVVQQKQGRVRPNSQMKGDIDDNNLEKKV